MHHIKSPLLNWSAQNNGDHWINAINTPFRLSTPSSMTSTAMILDGKAIDDAFSQDIQNDPFCTPGSSKHSKYCHPFAIQYMPRALSLPVAHWSRWSARYAKTHEYGLLSVYIGYNGFAEVYCLIRRTNFAQHTDSESANGASNIWNDRKKLCGDATTI